MALESLDLVGREESMTVPGGHEVDEEAADGVASHALRSQVASAVLGLVIEQPSHGYEIAQRLASRFGGAFRSTQRSSIYAALRSLDHAGLIEKMPGRSATSARRGAKAGAPFRATPRGARAFRVFLAESVRSDPTRLEMLGRMVLAGMHSVEAIEDFLNRFEEGCAAEAQEIASTAGDVPAESGLSALVARLLIEQRRLTVDAQFAWIDYARAEVHALAERTDGAPT